MFRNILYEIIRHTIAKDKRQEDNIQRPEGDI